MRHGVAGKRLARTTSHREAMLANMVTSLFKHEKIKTTVPKAKEARKLAEKMITLGKKGTLHARRQAFRTIHDEEILNKIFATLGPRYAARPGGYTRITRLGQRLGDAADMAVLELVDRAATEKKAEKAEAK
jgi:large subunit ribosomal protein L17